MALDQQVTVQQAFAGPQRLKQRLGTLDPKEIAAADPAEVEAAFKEKPAIHRFPGSMASRVQDIARLVTDEYGGHAERLWMDAADPDDPKTSGGARPGFGDMSVRTLGVILEKRFGVPAAQGMAPDHMTLGDVDSHESLAEYQAAKRAQ